MSQKRTKLYGSTSVPTSRTLAYTADANLHIDAVSAVNDTGSGIDLTIEVDNVPVFVGNVASNTSTVVPTAVNHGGLAATIHVTAGSANLNLFISGRDF